MVFNSQRINSYGKALRRDQNINLEKSSLMSRAVTMHVQTYTHLNQGAELLAQSKMLQSITMW